MKALEDFKSEAISDDGRGSLFLSLPHQKVTRTSLLEVVTRARPFQHNALCFCYYAGLGAISGFCVCRCVASNLRIRLVMFGAAVDGTWFFSGV